MIYPILTGIIVIVVAVFFFQDRKEMKEALAEIAAHYGWTYEDQGRLRVGRTVGTWKAPTENLCHCTIDRYKEGYGKGENTYVRFAIRLPIDKSLEVTSEGLGDKLLQAVSGKDIQTGVTEFDSKALIKADSADLAVSYLGTSVQQSILRYIETKRQIAIDNGRVRLLIETNTMSAKDMRHRMDNLMTLAEQLLESGPTIPARLAYHFEHDIDKRIRARCMEYLFLRHPDSEECKQVAKQVAQTNDPLLQVKAAPFLPKEEAQPIVLAIANNKRVDADTRAEAIKLLTTSLSLDPDKMAPLLIELLQEQNWTIREATIQGYLDQLYDIDLPTLSILKELALEEEATQYDVLPNLLAHYEEPEVEDILLELLERSSSDTFTNQVILSLMSVGTVRSIEALIPLTQGLMRAIFIKDTAREAIKTIQGRASGDVGGLSLSEESEEGGLSLTETHPGALSTTDESDE